MKAFIVDRYGKKNGVRIGEMPDPDVRENDVLVQVHAAAVNLLDSKIRNGEFKLILPYRLPLILGNDVAGVVVRVGSRVRRFKPGDQVYARPPQDRIGSFAELISMNEDAVAIMPTFAIQLAKHFGATVATTTSTANLDLVKSLGADTAIDYKTTDFDKVLSDYDVVLNSLGTETLNKSLQVLKPGGKLISISGPPDPDFAKGMGASWILRQIMRLLSYRIRKKAKRHHVSYSFLFMKADGGQLRAITSLIDSGIIRPVVDRVFPFESTKEAMAYVENGRSKGRVIVKVR